MKNSQSQITTTKSILKSSQLQKSQKNQNQLKKQTTVNFYQNNNSKEENLISTFLNNTNKNKESQNSQGNSKKKNINRLNTQLQPLIQNNKNQNLQRLQTVQEVNLGKKPTISNQNSSEQSLTESEKKKVNLIEEQINSIQSYVEKINSIRKNRSIPVSDLEGLIKEVMQKQSSDGESLYPLTLIQNLQKLLELAGAEDIQSVNNKEDEKQNIMNSQLMKKSQKKLTVQQTNNTDVFREILESVINREDLLAISQVKFVSEQNQDLKLLNALKKIQQKLTENKKELGGSISDLVQILLDQMLKDLEGKISNLQQKKGSIEKHDEHLAMISSFQDENEELKQKLDQQKKDFENKLDQQKIQYQQELDQQKKDFENKLDQQKNQHQQELEKQENQHQKELQEQKIQHQQELEKQEKANQDLQKANQQLQQNITKLQQIINATDQSYFKEKFKETLKNIINHLNEIATNERASQFSKSVSAGEAYKAIVYFLGVEMKNITKKQQKTELQNLEILTKALKEVNFPVQTVRTQYPLQMGTISAKTLQDAPLPQIVKPLKFTNEEQIRKENMYLRSQIVLLNKKLLEFTYQLTTATNLNSKFKNPYNLMNGNQYNGNNKNIKTIPGLNLTNSKVIMNINAEGKLTGRDAQIVGSSQDQSQQVTQRQWQNSKETQTDKVIEKTNNTIKAMNQKYSDTNEIVPRKTQSYDGKGRHGKTQSQILIQENKTNGHRKNLSYPNDLNIFGLTQSESNQSQVEKLSTQQRTKQKFFFLK